MLLLSMLCDTNKVIFWRKETEFNQFSDAQVHSFVQKNNFKKFYLYKKLLKKGVAGDIVKLSSWTTHFFSSMA